MYKIPLQVLLACCVCVNKKFRYCEYLDHIKIQDGYVVGLDMHRMLVCEIDGLDKSLDLFIHPKHVKDLSADLKGTEKFGDVDISIEQLDDGDYATLTFKQKSVTFLIKDVGVYPRNIKRLVDVDTFVDTMTQFNWEYLASMQKVGKLLGISTNVKVKPTGARSGALVEFIKSDDTSYSPHAKGQPFKAVGVVMPKLI